MAMRKKLQRFYQALRIAFYRTISSAKNVSGKPKLKQPLLLTGSGEFSFGENTSIGYFPSPLFFNSYAHFETRSSEASITIGHNVMINNNCFICSEGVGVSIGNDCLLGHNVQIFDSDFHALDPAERRTGKPNMAATKIGNNVFIGANVIITKGVSIGDHAVIGAGSVVTQDIPVATIAAGNPAKVIKPL
jgi:maltose O-acetyltransferase